MMFRDARQQESPRKLSEERIFSLHEHARYKQEALRFADPPDRTLRIISKGAIVVLRSQLTSLLQKASRKKGEIY